MSITALSFPWLRKHWALVMLGVILLGLPANLLTQERGSQTLQRPYVVVRDIVFPWPGVDDPVDFVTITMRLSPSASPESLIELRFESPEKVVINSSKAGLSIDEILPRGDLPPNLEPANLAQALRIVRKKTQINGPVAKRWFDELWTSLASSSTTTKENLNISQLDGTVYELQVRTKMATWTLHIVDAEARSAINGRNPIVRWMNSVRVALDSQ
jgi:hypothetical protein